MPTPSDEKIYEMTGLYPEPRAHVPLAETVHNLQQYQAGQEAAGLALVRWRLNWLHTTFATAEMGEATGYEAQDIMQIGMIKTLEVAGSIEYQKKNNLTADFQSAVRAALRPELLSLPEEPTPAKLLHDKVESDRAARAPSVEDEVFGNQIIAAQGLARAVRYLTSDSRYVLASRHGLGIMPKTQAELAQELDVTKQAISIRLERIYDTIRTFELRSRLTTGMGAAIASEGAVNLGLIPAQDVPRFSAASFSYRDIHELGGWRRFSELYPDARYEDFFPGQRKD